MMMIDALTWLQPPYEKLTNQKGWSAPVFSLRPLATRRPGFWYNEPLTVGSNMVVIREIETQYKRGGQDTVQQTRQMIPRPRSPGRARSQHVVRSPRRSPDGASDRAGLQWRAVRPSAGPAHEPDNPAAHILPRPAQFAPGRSPPLTRHPARRPPAGVSWPTRRRRSSRYRRRSAPRGCWCWSGSPPGTRGRSRDPNSAPCPWNTVCLFIGA